MIFNFSDHRMFRNDRQDIRCAEGHTGTYCQEKCPNGFFGLNCARRCKCANHSYCSPEYGTCLIARLALKVTIARKPVSSDALETIAGNIVGAQMEPPATPSAAPAPA